MFRQLPLCFFQLFIGIFFLGNKLFFTLCQLFFPGNNLAPTCVHFFLRIRQAQPELPIILASQTDCVMTAAHRENIEKRRQVVLKTYHNALARGDKNVYFVDGREVFKRAEKLGMGPEACTVDGCHPNDLGFACMAEAFGEVIEKVL